MCPVHTTVTESNAGTCRMCGRQLVPVTVSLTWTCQADRATEHLEPGTCADGSPRIGRRTLRAHGNHNPQHGGQFFMAPDNWHHLEGVHPAARVFRLYVYDDFGRPLAAAKMKDVQARVVTKETFDPATRKTTEVRAFPLKTVRNRPYLEARIDPATLPAEMTAKVKFGSDQPEHRFDFTFAVALEGAGGANRADIGAAAALAADDAAPAPAPVPTSSADPSLTPPPIPTSMSGMLEHLGAREKEVGELIARGDFAAVWVPAFQAKDTAIALEPHLGHLTPQQRDAGEPALARVVRTAWLLDAAGDVGNRAQIEAVYAAFKTAVADVLAAFGEVRLMTRHAARACVSLAIAVALAVVVSVERGDAHKPITSPYSYNDDVFPILRDQCGRCHVSGGVAPMSLMTHAEAVPWGESIRTEILAGHMPPGTVDEAPSRFRNVPGLSPREMNLLLTWVTGGTPIGSPEKDPAPVARDSSWRLGPPDLALPMPTEFVAPEDVRERTAEFIVPTGIAERRWVRAVDLMPGTAAMVRAATIAVRSPASPGSGASVERMLAVWLPGDEPIAPPDGLAFELPAVSGARRARALPEDVGVRAQGAARPEHGGDLLCACDRDRRAGTQAGAGLHGGGRRRSFRIPARAHRRRAALWRSIPKPGSATRA